MKALAACQKHQETTLLNTLKPKVAVKGTLRIMPHDPSQLSEMRKWSRDLRCPHVGINAPETLGLSGSLEEPCC